MRLITEKNTTENYSNWRQRLVNYIKDTKDVIILAEKNSAPHILSIAFFRIKGEVAVNHFQENGITISTSSACSSKTGKAGHVIEAIRLTEPYKQGVIRISFGENNELSDVVKFEKVFSDFVDILQRGKSNEME
jgi:cysteine desulfurase